jgi:hypothetical protein
MDSVHVCGVGTGNIEFRKIRAAWGTRGLRTLWLSCCETFEYLNHHGFSDLFAPADPLVRPSLAYDRTSDVFLSRPRKLLRAKSIDPYDLDGQSSSDSAGRLPNSHERSLSDASQAEEG